MLNSTTTVLKNGSSIKLHTKVDMPFKNKEIEPEQKGLNSTTTALLKDGSSIKYPTRVDMPFKNKEINQNKMG